MQYCLEIGQSHDGSLGYVYAILKAMSIRNLRIAKFQMHFPANESTAQEKFRVNLTGQDRTRADYWKRTGFSIDQWAQIKKWCDEFDIEFLCTPVSTYAVDLLQTLNVKRFKIGSADLNNFELLHAVASTNKPIILSTGMSAFGEIAESLDFLVRLGAKRIILLQCTSSYPATLEQVGLNVISEFKTRWPNLSVGYSDHSGLPEVAMWAFSTGAEFVEQHIVFSKEQFGPDTLASVTLEDAERVQRFINIGNFLHEKPVNKDYLDSNLLNMRMLFGRGLSVKNRVNKGDIILLENLTLKKPMSKYGWSNRFEFAGKIATRDIDPNTHLDYSDIS